MVHKVLMDPERNRARGVLYVDRVTRQSVKFRARRRLCAHPGVRRILLNSATSQHSTVSPIPAASSATTLTAHVRQRWRPRPIPDFGAKASLGAPEKPRHLHARFRNFAQRSALQKVSPRLRYEGESSTEFSWGAPGFGEAYKKGSPRTRHKHRNHRLRRSPPALCNFVELDPSVKTSMGIPVLKIHMSDGENERAMIQDMGDSAGEMLKPPAQRTSAPTLILGSALGLSVNEVGIASMMVAS